MIAALVAVAAVFAFLWIQARDTEDSEVTRFLASQEEAVIGTAEEVLDAIINYSPITLGDQAARVEELATGGFLKDYETLLESGLGEAVEQTGASSTGRIASGPEIAFVSAARATAVARVVQEVETSRSERTVFSVMQIGLVHTDSGWKAEQLQILSQNFL